MDTGEGQAAPDGPRVFRVAVLASGSGSNLQAIIDQLHEPGRAAAASGAAQTAGAPPAGEATATAPNAAGHPADPRIEVVLVISDVPGARASQRAAQAGIPTAVIPSADYADRRGHDLALVAALRAATPDLVVLAGYMRMVTPALLEAFPWKVINLHPALLPSFPGTHSIAEAVAYGVKVTGVTVHFVDPGMDTGPVIAQEPVSVENGDTADTLGARIHELEHRLLPEVIRLLAAGRVRPPLPGSRMVQVD